jgi:archaellum component FlaC
MLTKLWELTTAVLTLARDLQQYRQEQERIKQELRDLTIIVHALAQEIKNSKEQSQQRHENLLLEIENRLLKFEKALPPAKASKKSAKKGSKK